VRRSTRLVLGVAALAVIAVACAPHASQDTLKPAGPYAEKIDRLFVPIFWFAVVPIFVLVEGLLIWVSLRYRHRKGRPAGIPPQIHGNTRLEIAWTILPAVILAGVAVPTVATIWDLSAKPTAANVMNVDVLGHQWWWEFRYRDQKIDTANVMHIPVGVPVYVRLCSAGSGFSGPAPNDCQADLPVPSTLGGAVIHSFWVPQLAGKQDVVPDRSNTLVLEAEHPGVFTGQCAEFCGLSHAYMRFKVVAQSAPDFDQWVRDQQAEAAQPTGLAAQGAGIFAQTCTRCHTINGLKDAQGNPVPGAIEGPNLTHLMSRDCFAGCIYDVNTENLIKWVSNAPERKPGSLMPSGLYDLGLTPDQVRAVVAYLETLK
jgi:cytochrome c oxidase subunit II